MGSSDPLRHSPRTFSYPQITYQIFFSNLYRGQKSQYTMQHNWIYVIVHSVYRTVNGIRSRKRSSGNITVRCSLLYPTYADLTMYYDSLMKSRLPTTEAKMIPPRGLIV